MIDDEADQASVNTKDPEDRRVINRLILELLDQPEDRLHRLHGHPVRQHLHRPADPEDLYPRDFIVDLPRPTGYFGPEQALRT